MVIVWALSWWYGAGWKARALIIRERILRTMDYFSIDLLVKTLFSPFRQISAGKVNGPIGVKWRAFVDRLISRVIGAFVRVLFIVIGGIWLLFHIAYGGISLLLWAIIPVLPIIGFIAALAGWVPSWI